MTSTSQKPESELQGRSDIRQDAVVDMYACSTINTIMAVAVTARKLSLNSHHNLQRFRGTPRSLGK